MKIHGQTITGHLLGIKKINDTYRLKETKDKPDYKAINKLNQLRDFDELYAMATQILQLKPVPGLKGIFTTPFKPWRDILDQNLNLKHLTKKRKGE